MFGHPEPLSVNCVKTAAALCLAGALGLGFGAPKKAVMLPFCLGFLDASVAAAAALRFRLIIVMSTDVEYVLRGEGRSSDDNGREIE